MSGNLAYQEELREELREELLVHLTEKDTFVPDVMVVCDRGKIRRNGVYGSPDLLAKMTDEEKRWSRSSSATSLMI